MPHALFTLVALLVSFGLYLMFAGQVSGTELIAAVPVALACTAAALLFRLREERRLRLPLPPMRAVSHVLASLAVDTARVGAILLRSLLRRHAGAVGAVASQPFHPGDGRPQAAGRRALVVLGASLAPNGYVLKTEDEMVLHRLAAARPGDDPEWPV